MNQVGATLFETLLFLYFKKTAMNKRDAEHTLCLCTSGKKKKKEKGKVKRKKQLVKLQGLRANIMSPSGFPWYHTDSSIKLLFVSIYTLSHSGITVLINQTAPRCTLINFILTVSFQAGGSTL